MAITQGFCVSAKSELFTGTHVIGTDVLKIALYTSASTVGPASTAYTATGEVTGTGYTAGGNTLTGVTITTSGSTVFLDFADTAWTTATITARGCMVYNSTKANRALAVYDFGADVASTAGTFTVVFPTPDATNAVVRIT